MLKKIAIVIPNITNKAGTERAVANLANILTCQGHNVCILSIASETGNCPYELHSSIEIIHLNLPFKSSSISFVINHYSKIFRETKQIISSKKIDIIIGTYTLINLLLTFLPKHIQTIGCEHFNYAASGKIQNILKRLFYQKLNAVVLLTERDKNQYFFLKNAYVIPNSLSFTPKSKSICETHKIITLGRLTYQKGFDLLIDVINLIKTEIGDWKVEIYGSGKDKTLLEEKIRKYSLNNIVFIKPTVSDVESVYNSSSIYVSTSRFEGLPMTLLEAQSCGIPCVVYDCPCGPAEIIEDNITGFVIPLFNKEVFADKLLQLMYNEELRKKLGKKAVFESRRYSTDSVSILWENLLNLL